MLRCLMHIDMAESGNKDAQLLYRSLFSNTDAFEYNTNHDVAYRISVCCQIDNELDGFIKTDVTSEELYIRYIMSQTISDKPDNRKLYYIRRACGHTICKIFNLAQNNGYKIYTDFDAVIRLMVSFLDGTRRGWLKKN